MEEIAHKLGWKKTAAILIAIAIVALVFVAISFSNLDNKAVLRAIENFSQQHNTLGGSR